MDRVLRIGYYEGVRLWWPARLGGRRWQSLPCSETRQIGHATTVGLVAVARSTLVGSWTCSQTRSRALWTETRAHWTGAVTSARSALISLLGRRQPSARGLRSNHPEQPPASRSVLVGEARAHCCSEVDREPEELFQYQLRGGSSSPLTPGAGDATQAAKDGVPGTPSDSRPPPDHRATGSSPTDGDSAYDRCADCGHTRVYHIGAGGAAIGCQLISVQTDAQCFCEAFADPQATPDRVAITLSQDELVVLISALKNRYVKAAVKRPLMDALAAALQEIDRG